MAEILFDSWFVESCGKLAGETTVSAVPDVLIDEVTVEKTDLFSLDVVTSVIVESDLLIVPTAIIERGYQFSDVFSEVKVELISLQFYIYRDLSAMIIEDLNLQSTTKDLTTIRHHKIKSPNIGYNDGPLRYTARHI